MMVVLPLGITTIISFGTIQYLFGVMLTPIARDLHWASGRMSIAYSLCLLVAGALGMVVGRHVDAGRGRLLLTVGSALAAISFWLLSMVQTLPQFYAIWGIGLAGAAALTYYPVSFAIAGQWFKAAPAQALLAITLFGGLAAPVFQPLEQSLVAHLGWRHALVAIALIQLLIAVPIHAFWVRYPARASIAREANAPARMPSLLLDVRFLLITTSAVLSVAGSAFLTVHFIPFELGRGWNAGTAAMIAGLCGFGSIPGRAFGGALLRRFDSFSILCACTFAQAVATIVMAAAHTLVPVGCAALLSGAGYGLSPAMRAAAMMAVFGPQRFGSMNGAQGLPLALAAAAAPAIGGAIFDRTGSYMGGFIIFSAAAALGSVVLLPLVAARSARLSFGWFVRLKKDVVA